MYNLDLVSDRNKNYSNYSIYAVKGKPLFTSNGFVGKLSETIQCEKWFQTYSNFKLLVILLMLIIIYHS